MELALALLLAGLAGLCGSVAHTELKAWTPRLVARLISMAITKLPEADRERYLEEWTSHIEEIPGYIGKLLAAAGLLSVSANIEQRLSLLERLEYAAHYLRFKPVFHKALMAEFRKSKHLHALPSSARPHALRMMRQLLRKAYRVELTRIARGYPPFEGWRLPQRQVD